MAGDDEIMGAFLGATGAAPGDLKTAAADPGFLGAVLDHLLTRDDWVLGFAEADGCGPELVQSARAALPGGEAVHWT